MKISFTGHRDIKDLSSLKKAIESLSFSDSDEFLVGGSTGFDFLILNELLKRKLHSQITLCVPFRGFEKYLEKDSSILNSMLKIHYSSGLKIVEFNNKGNSFSEKTKARNQYMVDNAEILYCYWDGNFKSGTAQTVRMAERKKIKVINLMEKL